MKRVNGHTERLAHMQIHKVQPASTHGLSQYVVSIGLPSQIPNRQTDRQKSRRVVTRQYSQRDGYGKKSWPRWDLNPRPSIYYIPHVKTTMLRVNMDINSSDIGLSSTS